MPPDEEENAMVSTSESIDNSSLGKHHHDYNKQVTIFACFAIKKNNSRFARFFARFFARACFIFFVHVADVLQVFVLSAA